MPQENHPKLRDITVVLSSQSLVYPGDSPPSITRTSDLTRGDPLTASHLSMSCHIGTHVDAPAHFIEDGCTLENLPIESLYGPAHVVDLQGKQIISTEDVSSLSLPQRHHILLRTDNAALLRLDGYSERHCVLSPEAARYLCCLHPLSVGFDYYSLDPDQRPDHFPSHVVLARAGIPVFVCLDLFDITPGSYTFAGFPLRLAGAEASPVRALLIDKP